MFLNEASPIPYSTALVAFTRLAQVTRGIRQHAFVDLNPAGKSHWTNILFGEYRDPVSMQPLKDPENYRRAFLNPPDNTENLSEEFLASMKIYRKSSANAFMKAFMSMKSTVHYGRTRPSIPAVARPEGSPDKQRAAVVVALDPSGAAGRDDLGAEQMRNRRCGRGIRWRLLYSRDFPAARRRRSGQAGDHSLS